MSGLSAQRCGKFPVTSGEAVAEDLDCDVVGVAAEYGLVLGSEQLVRARARPGPGIRRYPVVVAVATEKKSQPRAPPFTEYAIPAGM